MAETTMFELAGAEQIPGFHPLMGLDDRAAAKGAQRNDEFNNINAFAATLRERDDAYYADMPLNTIDTDPGNTNKETQDINQLRAMLQERVANLAPSRTEDPVPLPVEPQQPPLNRSFWYEVTNWNSLPVEPGWSRVQYVFAREGRLMWLIVFIVVIMIIGYIAHMK